MAIPASPPSDTWAYWIDEAIQLIVNDHKKDPAWAGRFEPGDVADALAIACGWSSPDAYITTHAMQSHRKAQKNRPGVHRGPQGYCPRWLVSYSRRNGCWIITAYRDPMTGNMHRFIRANATSLTNLLVNELVRVFQSDYVYEIVPTLEEHPTVANMMGPLLAGSLHPYLTHLSGIMEASTKNLAQVLTLAERKQVHADIAACTTMDEAVAAFAEALVAAGVPEDEIWEDVEA